MLSSFQLVTEILDAKLIANNSASGGNMKKCSQCGVLKDESEFTKNKSSRDGFGYLCEPCRSIYNKIHMEKYRAKNGYKPHARTEKRKAHEAVARALRRGKIIKPALCESCHLEKRLEGHHADYGKRLEVVWLCRKCHFNIHRNLVAAKSRKPS